MEAEIWALSDELSSWFPPVAKYSAGIKISIGCGSCLDSVGYSPPAYSMYDWDGPTTGSGGLTVTDIETLQGSAGKSSAPESGK
jgi:hypothetical protein